MKKDHARKSGPDGASPAPLAIIGIGSLFPNASDLETFWANIKNGVDAITEVPPTHWNPEDYYSDDPKKPDFTYGRRGGFIPPQDFDPLNYGIPPNSLEATDTSQLLGMAAAEAAMRDAGYGPDSEFDRDRVSVIIGVTGTLELVIPLGARLGHPKWRRAMLEAGVDPEVAEDAVQRIADSYVPWQENSFPGLLGNVVAGRISKHLNTGGTNCVVDAACASSISAIHLAAMELATGKADMVITGGIDTFNDIFMYMCFSKTPALSPSGHARPFDHKGDGTTLGEGLGLLVLKRLDDAERDGDSIYAVLKGVGSSSDGKGDAIYAPSSPGQVKALRAAYAAADVGPDTIELVEAHGTGTAKGDAVEAAALNEVYGTKGKRPWCALGSVKSQIGHTKAAAGAAGIIKATMALHHKVLPPTLKVDRPLDEFAPGASAFYVNTLRRPWVSNAAHPRRAAVSAFGFGGSNFHAVLEEYAPQKTAPDWDGAVQIFALSAANNNSLTKILADIPTGDDWEALRGAAAESRKRFNSSDACRLLLVIENDGADLKKRIAAATAMLAKNGRKTWSTPDGTFFAHGDAQGTVAFLFPGQGAQSPGMLRDLACTFPEMLAALEQANDAYAETTQDAALSDCIYPHPAFDDDTRLQHEAALRATGVAQPAIGAVSLGAFHVLQSFGVSPAAVAGHSYGELTALYAAGRLDAASFLKASVVRGRLMAECVGGGAMLAVRAAIEDVEKTIANESLKLVLANKNAPEQAVLSGPAGEIDRAKQAFDAQNVASTKLDVAAAFHSESVADASGPFLETLEGLPFNDADLPVFSNTTGAEYPADSGEARQLLASQLARPVEFVAEIEALYAAGARTFVEVGPGARLTGLVNAILGDQNHQAIAIDASSGKRSGITDLARTLALVAAQGHTVALTEWDGAYQAAPADAQKKPRLIVPISGANYRSTKPAARAPARAPKPTPATTKPRTAPPAQPRATHAAPAPPPVSRETAPLPVSAAPPIAASPTTQGGLAELLRQTQANIAALQHVQAQTARLHGQFLEGQAQAAQTFQALLHQHQQLFQAGASSPAVPAPPTFVQPPAQPVAASPIPEPAATAPPAPAAVLIAQEPAASPLQGILLDIVAEKTGYPSDMLELGMSLDADLGIDSIKRVEILSALQEQIPELPTVQSESLGTIQTLGDIVALLEPDGAPTQTTASSATPDNSQIHTLLFEVIAEKTGYPAEMLELDMSLDADLGIDSIKRVEILSAIQEQMPELPSVEAEVLGSLQTLRDVVEHLDANAPQAPAAAPSTDQSKLQELLLSVIAEKTGYPAEMLELDMSLDADLGIDSIKRVEILSAIQEQMPELPALEAETLGALQTLRDVMEQLGDATASATPATPSAAQPAPAAPAPAQRADRAIYRGLVRAELLAEADSRGTVPLRDGAVFWIAGEGDELSDAIAARLAERGYTASVVPCDPEKLPALPELLDGLVLVSPETNTDDTFLKSAFGVVQAASAALRASAKESAALLATVSRLDGQFGLAGLAADLDPSSGGLAGLTKTASHEWPSVHCKAIDLDRAFDINEAAQRIADELLSAGPLEVGIAPDGLYVPRIEAVSLPTSNGSVPLTADDVVLITGGARGVTAEIAVALAKRFGCTPVLLGRSPAPQPEEEWLASLSDEAAIKRALRERGNGNIKPKQLEGQYRAIAANRQILRTIERIGATGVRAVYRSVDVRDASAVSACVAEVENEVGPVTGLIHGAGVLADRKIEDKTAEQFDAVYDTKVSGLRNFLGTLDTNDLKLLVLFSSSTARFGRTGQVDYAMANEVLNKIAQREALRRPGARILSINWGPWAGGMVTPSLEKVFEREGIGLIGLEQGAAYLIDEIGAGQRDATEIVVMGSELPVAAPQEQPDAAHLSQAFDFAIDAERYPFLKSHVMDGKAVLPVAIYIEWFAHAALHGNPGLRFQGVDDLHVYKGVVLGPEESRRIKLYSARARKRDDLHIVTVEMRSAGDTGREVIHARAEVVLGTKPAVADAALEDIALEPYSQTGQGLYGNGTLFHGEAFNGIQEITGCDSRGIRATCKTAPSPSKWIDEPLRKTWIADPLVLDSAFQMMILWTFDQDGTGSLPCYIGRYRQCRATYPKGKIDVHIRVNEHNDHRATATIEFLNPKNGKLIARIDDYECVIDESLNAAFQRNQLTQESLSP